MTLKVDKDGKVSVTVASDIFEKMAAAPKNIRTKEEIKASLIKHYERYGTPSYMQHMFDLDEEYPEVDIFGPQCISAEVGPGWNKLLRPIMDVLRENGCKAGQIKQKFGGLRFYWDYPDRIEAAMAEWRAGNHKGRVENGDLVFDVPLPYKEERDAIAALVRPIVELAEKLSYRTCEECGNDTGREGGPSFRTECDDCKQKKASGGRGSVAKRQQ